MLAAAFLFLPEGAAVSVNCVRSVPRLLFGIEPTIVLAAVILILEVLRSTWAGFDGCPFGSRVVSAGGGPVR